MNFIARFHLLHFHIFCLSRRIDFWIWDFVWKAGSWVRNQTLCEIINLVVCGNQPPISLTNYQLIIARRVIDHLFHWKYALNFDLNCIESTLYFVRINLCKRKKLLISSGGRERGGKVLQKRKVTRPASAIFCPFLSPPTKFKLFSILDQKGGNRKRAQVFCPPNLHPKSHFHKNVLLVDQEKRFRCKTFKECRDVPRCNSFKLIYLKSIDAFSISNSFV